MHDVVYFVEVVLGEVELGGGVGRTRNIGDGLVDSGCVQVVWSAGLVESLLAASRVC